MARSIRLSEAIDLFVLWRRSNIFAENTIVGDLQALRMLRRIVGDIQVRNITEQHTDRLFLHAARTRRNSSLNDLLFSYLAFFKWCARRRYIPAYGNPVADRAYFAVDPEPKRRVQVQDFPRLLQAAQAVHPRDRMVIALGLYLLLRGSEAINLRIGDVRLEAGKVRVKVFKSKKTVWMPICAELDEELRTWLGWYANWAQRERRRSLDDSWYLVPAKRAHRLRKDPATSQWIHNDEIAGLKPDRPINHVWAIAKRALATCGYPVRDADGKPTWDGMHTLRRSGARALWDSLLDRGFDRATFRVQAMLHHKDPKTTLQYIGYDEEEEELMRTLRGQVMYPAARLADNVVDLPQREPDAQIQVSTCDRCHAHGPDAHVERNSTLPDDRTEWLNLCAHCRKLLGDQRDRAPAKPSGSQPRRKRRQGIQVTPIEDLPIPEYELKPPPAAP